MAASSIVRPPAWRRTGLAVCLLAWTSWASAAELQQPARFEAERVVVVGDVHGAYDPLVELLVHSGIIDDHLTWRGGRTHLVSLGDLLDRGPGGRKVMDLLRRLQPEASAAGGRVHVLLGNHEVMNLTGDLRYVSPADIASFADYSAGIAAGSRLQPAERRAAAFAPDGSYGAWLLARPLAVVINDTAFVHGGLSELTVGTTPEGTNSAASAALAELLTLRRQLAGAGLFDRDQSVDDAAQAIRADLEQDDDSPIPQSLRLPARRFAELAALPLFGPNGPLWYRGTAWCDPLIEQPVLDRALAAWGVARLVVGHTPTADHRVHARLDGRALLADTGMLAERFHGRASALILERGQPPRVVYGDAPTAVAAPEVDDGFLLFPLAEADVARALETAPLSATTETAGAGARAVRLGSGQLAVAATFTPASSQSVRAELAAWRLDRLLGLNLAAPLAARRMDGRDGVVRAVWTNAITESERLAAKVAVPEPCSEGSNYDVLRAFDALIANLERSADTLLYEPQTWRLASISHGRSFSRTSRFPRYLDKAPHRLPPLLARRLRSLDAAGLRKQLGDLLGNGEIEALLRRRDALLDTWTVEN